MKYLSMNQIQNYCVVVNTVYANDKRDPQNQRNKIRNYYDPERFHILIILKTCFVDTNQIVVVNKAEKVIQIIRFFKQGMAPIRSQSRLFLKSPHTFKLQYIHERSAAVGVPDGGDGGSHV